MTSPPTNPHGAPHVVGIDLSLTASGIARPDGIIVHGRDRLSTIPFVTDRAHALDELTEELFIHVMGRVPRAVYPHLVAVEDLNQRGGAAGISTEKAYVWWRLISMLDAHGVPVLAVPVKTAKLYACGMGDANKREVIAAIARDLPEWEIRRPLKSGKLSTKPDENMADALTMRAVGMHLLDAPMVEATDFRLRALEVLTLPPGVRR